MNRTPILRAALAAAITVTACPALARAGGETARLVSADSEADDAFGASLAIDGTRALIGAYLDDDSGINSGSCYLFDTTTGQQILKLLPNDGAQTRYFGRSVALDGGFAVAGASHDESLGDQAGSAYVFDTTTGQQLAKLLASDGAPLDQFGFSVAISGTTVLVGARWDDDLGDESGSVYVFDAASGQERAKLHASDGAALDIFGYSVAIQGTTAIIGAPNDFHGGGRCGSAYLFDTSTGLQVGKLVPADAGCGGMFGKFFGGAVAIHGTTAIVGALYDQEDGMWAGSAYLFDTTTGQQLARLRPEVDGLYFGTAVGISGATAIVGMPFHLPENGQNAAAAFLYDTTTGALIAELSPSDVSLVPTDFGRAVALDGSTALVGSPLDIHNGSLISAGAAYLFDASQGIARSYCFGDGGGTACPCSNGGAEGHGCANSAFVDGARLAWTGSPCVGNDDFALRVTSSRPNQTGLFFQGDNALNGGLGVPFGDGLRCAGGNVLRLEVAKADASGAASSTVPLAATAGLSAGEVKRCQWWYRDPGASLCGNAFNLSNGLEVIWGP